MALKSKQPKAAVAKLAISNVAPAPNAKAPAAKSAKRAPAIVTAAIVTAAAPTNAKPATDVAVLRKKDLIDKVVATTGAKKAVVRDIIEATLGVLGDALSNGATLIVPPFGKARVSRGADGSGKPMTVKLRRGPVAAGGGTPKQALADLDD